MMMMMMLMMTMMMMIVFKKQPTFSQFSSLSTSLGIFELSLLISSACTSVVNSSLDASSFLNALDSFDPLSKIGLNCFTYNHRNAIV